MPPPYATSVRLHPDASLKVDEFPGNLKFTQGLQLEFASAVTFFVGENGSGKSTLLEAIAVLAGFPIAGGGTNELAESHGINEESKLADELLLGFTKRPRDGYFFRAELQAHFASMLDERMSDEDFTRRGGDPYGRYGGRSLHRISHGEAFLSVMQNRFGAGFFLLDEPESALSPQRQLALLALMHRLVEQQKTQFIIATHSPILLTYPGSTIISFDDGQLSQIQLGDTSHYQITTGILSRPESYWKHLRASGNEPPAE